MGGPGSSQSFVISSTGIRFVYTWSEVLEEDEAREKLVEADEPRPRAEKYELKACPDAGVEHRLNSVCVGSSWLVGSLARVAH